MGRTAVFKRVLSRAAIWIAALIVAGPIAAVLASLFAVSDQQAHLWSTVGVGYVVGTLKLCALVGVGAGVIGGSAAFLVTMVDFPGRRAVAALLAFPLAMPAYVAAYAYGDMLSPFGAGAVALAAFGLPTPDLRNLGGAAFILTLTTYPYVYLAVRAGLAARSSGLLEAAQTLGARPMRAVRDILAPALRPAFAGGLALVLMETVGDYGVADYFGASTLSVGIFRTWRGMGDLVAASQLAGGLFLVALALVALERSARKGRRDEGARAGRAPRLLQADWPVKAFALVFCALPFAFGFALPLAHLFALAWSTPLAGGAAGRLLQAATTTGAAGLAGAALITGAGVALAAARPRAAGAAAAGPRMMEGAALTIATLGYALPGALVAIGLLQMTSILPGDLGGTVIATGGAGLLLYGYTVRFLTIADANARAGLDQISPAMAEAARASGAGPRRVALAVQMPLAYRAIVAGGVVVFIEIVKELPATLILRPFGVETLATQVYRLAGDERLASAAPAALCLVAASVLPLMIAHAVIDRPRVGRRRQTYTPADAAAASTQSQI